MIKDCKEAGNLPPKYAELGGSFSVTLFLREPIARTIISSAPSVKLTERQQEIMKILKQGPLGRKQIIDEMKGQPAGRTVQRELLTLNKLGLIASEGKGKAVVWVLLQK